MGIDNIDFVPFVQTPLPQVGNNTSSWVTGHFDFNATDASDVYETIRATAAKCVGGSCAPSASKDIPPTDVSSRTRTGEWRWSDIAVQQLQRGVESFLKSETTQKVALLCLLLLGIGLMIDRKKTTHVFMEQPRDGETIAVSYPDDDGVSRWQVSSKER